MQQTLIWEISEPATVLEFSSQKNIRSSLDEIGKSQEGRQAIIDAACRYLDEIYIKEVENAINSPADMKQLVKVRLSQLKREEFWVVFLDRRKGVIKIESLFQGTIDSSVVYPREVVRCCLEYGATSIILVHNHPSGCSEPSQADIDITKKLTEVLQLIDVQVLDHLIVGRGEPASLAELQLM